MFYILSPHDEIKTNLLLLFIIYFLLNDKQTLPGYHRKKVLRISLKRTVTNYYLFTEIPKLTLHGILYFNGTATDSNVSFVFCISYD